MNRLPAAFEALLRVLPAEFREAHREGIAHLLTSYSAERGRAGRVWMWTRAGLDVAFVGVSLRVRRAWGRGGGVMSLTEMVGDVRFAMRALARRPGYAAVAVATLAVGIGANTAIFSVVDGVLLRPLPYTASERIGILWHEFGQGAQNLPAVHALDAWDYRDRSDLLEDVVVASGREWIVGGQDDPEIVDVGVVQAGFFEFFGATPVVGRTFTAEDDRPGGAPTVMLSHRLWVRRFGADPSVVGRAIEVAGTTMEVRGVLPGSFRLELPVEAFLLRDAELWAPARIDPGRQPPRNYTGFTGFVRLKPGVSFEQAQQELESMAAQLRAEHPEHAASNLVARVVPLHADVVKRARTTLLLLLGAVGLVLLIACANVANLVIMRGHARSTELSLRAALGAGRASLARLVLAESGLLAGAGAGLGVMLAWGVLAALRAGARASVPRLDAVTVDARVLGFVAGVTVLSVIAFGLVPALMSARRDPAVALAAVGRSSGTRGQRRFRDALVVGEVAASLVLLVGTGLLVRSFAALGAADPGYDLEGVLTFRTSLPLAGFPDGDTREAFHVQLHDELRGLPGVTAVAMIDKLPLTGSGSLRPYAYDAETRANWESVTADQRFVSPGFMTTMGARLVAGEDFTSADVAAGNSIIVDDRLARRAFGDEDPIGRELQVQPDDVPEDVRFARVVGVVEHLRIHDLGRPHLTQIWFPMQGAPRFAVIVRTDGDATALVPAVREVLARLAPGSPMDEVQTLEDLASASLAPMRLTLALMSGFGLVALLLASVGLYGVLAYAVAQRTREIGVRMALGQAPDEVRRRVLLDGARLLAPAILVGLVAAVVFARVMAGLVYGVEPVDPATYLVTTVVLTAVAALASWIPATRATRVDPTAALRE